MDAIKQASAEYLGELEAAKPLKWKPNDLIKIPIQLSTDLCPGGEYLLEAYPHLTVDTQILTVIIYVEVRGLRRIYQEDTTARWYSVGTGGKAAVLISGGIDSPVASWMMAKWR